MPAGRWRFLALLSALLALGFAMVDTCYIATFADNHLNLASADGTTYTRLLVTDVAGTPEQTGGLRVGDIVTPVGGYTLRMRQNADLPGKVYTWIVQRGSQPPFRTTSRVTQLLGNDLALNEIFNVVRLAMLLVAMLVAVRRPDVPAARALVAFLIVIAVTLVPGGVWLPDPALAAWRTLRIPLQCYSFYQGLRFACIFPFESAGGLRAWLERINPWYALVTISATAAFSIWLRITGTIPLAEPWRAIVQWMPIVYFPALVPAFTIAAQQATGRDRIRVFWAAGSICIGFFGPLLQILAIIIFHRNDAVLGYLPLTLIAIPLGLAYTILRHRTVDIGFVISRALVLTILSFLIVAAFGIIERALGKIFIDASHVASRSVEIALALGLGFSMRSLHSRIEKLVDRFFFRTRRRALAALRAFADDVYFITDPDVAIERTVEVTGRCTDAENAALYLIADGVFGRAAAVREDALPAEVDENDPLFVRMRASRHTEVLRHSGSRLDAEIAFPMFVRGTLVGALTLAAKHSGEAYDPEETALIADLAQRVGLALDALQTLAMRRELDALMLAR